MSNLKAGDLVKIREDLPLYDYYDDRMVKYRGKTSIVTDTYIDGYECLLDIDKERFAWSFEMLHKLYPNKLSDCHHKPVYVSSGVEGTNCYMCSKCDKICDDIPKKTETKKQKRLKNETSKSLDNLKKEFEEKFLTGGIGSSVKLDLLFRDGDARLMEVVWRFIEKALKSSSRHQQKHSLLDKLGWKVGDIVTNVNGDYGKVMGERLVVSLSRFSHSLGKIKALKEGAFFIQDWNEFEIIGSGVKLYKPKKYKLRGEYSREELKKILRE